MTTQEDSLKHVTEHEMKPSVPTMPCIPAPSFQKIDVDWIFPMDPKLPPAIGQGSLIWSRDRGTIEAVGRTEDLGHSFTSSAEAIPSHTLRCLTPGFINGHCHLELSTMPQISPRNHQMGLWLLSVVQFLRGISPEQMTDEAIERRCEQGIREGLRTGTTCFNDISSFGHSAKVLHRLGCRGRVALEFFLPQALQASQPPETLPPTLESIVQRFKKFSSEWRSHSLVSTGLSPHSPFNVSVSAWKEVSHRCDNPYIHAHVGESWDEELWAQGQPSSLNTLHQSLLHQSFYPSPPTANSILQYLEQHGVLEHLTAMAHGVFISKEHLDVLQHHQIGVIHCPRSNQFLHGQTLPWELLKHHNIPVALGTDGHVSTPSLDLREEAQAAMALHHWTPLQALQSLTVEGARVMRLQDQTGSFEPGKAADMVLWHWESKVPFVSQSDSDVWQRILQGVLDPQTSYAQHVWVQGINNPFIR